MEFADVVVRAHGVGDAACTAVPVARAAATTRSASGAFALRPAAGVRDRDTQVRVPRAAIG
jgi:hypothetical protein